MESPVGAKASRGVESTLGHFALVSYIPDPLARFLDELRLELTPDCSPHAHITILPPRPLEHGLKAIIHQIAEETRGIPPFWIETDQIEVFDVSNVVYLGLARGTVELKQLYRALNRGFLQYQENFPYHPHITIAQNLSPEDAPRAAAIARERWAAYQGPRGFPVSSLSFVQHVAPGIWADVVAVPLGVEVPVGH
jgi:2'-5' RNA ligase